MVRGRTAFCVALAAFVLWFGVAPLRAEPVSHHGTSVNPRAGMVECLVCHDGQMAKGVGYCTSGCSLITSHPVQRSYPPRGKESRYRPASGLKEYGVELVNGAVDCISCHDLENPEKNHLVPKVRDVGLCGVCHIEM